MHISYATLIISHSQVPQSADPTDPRSNVRCTHCGKLLAKVKGRILVVANTIGPGPTEIPVGAPMMEIKCPSCNTVHNIIWQ